MEIATTFESLSFEREESVMPFKEILPLTVALNVKICYFYACLVLKIVIRKELFIL